jgi:hypothetical protein
VKTIFKRPFSRAKPVLMNSEGKVHQRRASPRGMGRKRVGLLALILMSLAVVEVTKDVDSANGKARLASIKAAFKDPLNLFAERSPGERGLGALLSTKSSRGPHERVLSEVRDRDVPTDMLPGVDTPDFNPTPGDPADSALPGTATSPGNQPFGSSPSTPFFPGGGFPGATPQGLSAISNAPGLLPLQSDPVSLVDPQISGVPEPSTWVFMIIGFLAVGTALRRQVREKTAFISIK